MVGAETVKSFQRRLPMAHIIFFDYFPFTYCTLALLALANWRRLVADIDILWM